LYLSENLSKQDFVDVFNVSKKGEKLERTEESKKAERLSKKNVTTEGIVIFVFWTWDVNSWLSLSNSREYYKLELF